jgi:hypothetical protein
MTKQEAEAVAREMRDVGWETAWVEVDDNGKWRAVAVDWSPHDGWMHRLYRHRGAKNTEVGNH